MVGDDDRLTSVSGRVAESCLQVNICVFTVDLPRLLVSDATVSGWSASPAASR
jgi:hypothetical protein